MKNLLVVEDVRETRELLRIIFSERGYHVALAGTLKEAKCIMKDQRFDMVLCDVNLPDGNGYEFRARMAAPPPFLFLSGSGDSRESIDAGISVSFLMKPVNIADLIRHVHTVVGDADAYEGRQR